MMESGELLRAYVQHHSEPAFRELVERYFDLVYSVALRRVDGDTLLAQDAAQVVFTDLARKAASLPPEVTLGGWLHRHACFVAGTLGRGEQRRRQREKVAVEMNTLNEPSDADWKQVAPLLDEAIGQLEPADHTAIVLRYFEGRDLRAVGAALGTNEDAAQKRVSRAVNKLHAMLVQRGVALSAVGLGTLLASKAVAAAPAGLAGSVAGVAFAAGGGATMGLAAAGVKTITPVGLKVLAGTTALVVLTGALLLHPWKPNSPAQPAPAAAHQVSALAVTASQLATNPPLAASKAPPEASGALHLVVVAADSGKPVPNVELNLQTSEPPAFHVRQASCNRLGISDVPYSPTAERFVILTSTEGFADTRLIWQPKDGPAVPAAYTLRLTRPVAISGSVVDADDQPVAAAQVRFRLVCTNGGGALFYLQPEDHWFSTIETTTDADGYWSINRIAPEMLHQVSATATHPQYPPATLSSLIGNAEAEQQLRDGAYVFKLGRGLPFTGVVLDQAGQPVSEAEVIVGDRREAGSRTTKTAADGTFAVAGCKAGKTVLAVQAPEFAPMAVEADIKPEAAPLSITLQRSRDLRLRFADPAGNALAQRNVWLTLEYGPGATAGRLDELKTDAEGRLVCTNAPVGEITLRGFLSGGQLLETMKLQADGREHLITVASGSPPIVIAGTVKDLRSEQPIPSFRIFFGRFRAAQPDSQPELAWLMWFPYGGGQFQDKLPDKLPGYEAYGGCWRLRFQADGYAPFVSRVIRPDERDVRLDVKLRPADATTVNVLLPDGHPAAYADVAPVSPGTLLQLVPGGFSREGIFSAGFLLQTDSQGNASLPPDDAITRVVVANAAGYGEATSEALAAIPVLRLQPWGRLEGTLPAAPQSAADLTLFLDLEQQGLGSPDTHSFSAKPDEQGRFVFPRVPPGQHKLMRLTAPGATPAVEPLADIEIHSGQTITLSLGAAGPS